MKYSKRNHSDEEKIKILFKKLKENDEQQMPSFLTTIVRATSLAEKKKQVSYVLRFAVSFAILILVISSIFIFNKINPRHISKKTISITDWRSPTNSLLKFPGYSLTEAIQRQKNSRPVSQTMLSITGENLGTTYFLKNL